MTGYNIVLQRIWYTFLCIEILKRYELDYFETQIQEIASSFKILHQKKHLNNFVLKSIKYLVTLIYYIIKRFEKMVLDWKKKLFLYLSSRAKKIWTLNVSDQCAIYFQKILLKAFLITVHLFLFLFSFQVLRMMMHAWFVSPSSTYCSSFA